MKYENEIWKDIKGYKNIYQISNFGRVKNVIKCRILKLKQSKGFYIACNLRKKDIVSFKTIHRLVAIAFIPNPSKLKYINHINGIKTDNSIDNLEWVSARENTNHYHSTTEKSSKYTGVS